MTEIISQIKKYKECDQTDALCFKVAHFGQYQKSIETENPAQVYISIYQNIQVHQ